MLCSRYSFGPNRLHYCGPDANAELKSYITRNQTDGGLSVLLKKFETLYPYLCHIARANNIQDPFDTRVVEAYWIGNELLDHISKNDLHTFLIDGISTKKKMKSGEWRWLEEKISQGAMPHHSFHVLNVWQQTGHNDFLETVKRMDECRISSGTIISTNGPAVVVSTEPLIYMNGKLLLGPTITKTIYRSLESEYDIEQIKPGEIVSIHWSVPCEIISKEKAERLRKYTMQNIAFANQTL